MYVTEILRISSLRVVGPSFFSGEGPHDQYPTLKAARNAAEQWCASNGLAKNDVKIVSRIVGCL